MKKEVYDYEDFNIHYSTTMGLPFSKVHYE